MIHELKEQIITWCQPILDFCSSLGEFGLFMIAFMEASFFPIPPDFIYVPMILNGASSPYMLAFIATVGSVLGAVLGYIIGRFGGRPAAENVLGIIGGKEKADMLLDKAEEFFSQYGPVAILLAAFTPLPFKVFTVAGGISRMNLSAFTLFSFLGRGGRFFAVTYILIHFGKGSMDNFFKMSLMVGGVALVTYLGFLWYQKANNNNNNA